MLRFIPKKPFWDKFASFTQNFNTIETVFNQYCIRTWKHLSYNDIIQKIFLAKKLAKMSFLAQICLVYPNFGAPHNIFKNLGTSLFCNYGNVSSCKKSRKYTKGFPRTMCCGQTDRRTYGRTDGRDQFHRTLRQSRWSKNYHKILSSCYYIKKVILNGSCLFYPKL